MTASSGIHWLRALLGGFLAEVSVVALVLLIALLADKDTLTYTAPIALTCGAAGGLVAARRQRTSFQPRTPAGETQHP